MKGKGENGVLERTPCRVMAVAGQQTATQPFGNQVLFTSGGGQNVYDKCEFYSPRHLQTKVFDPLSRNTNTTIKSELLVKK